MRDGTLSLFTDCQIQRKGQEFILDASCLLEGKLPKLSIQESVDAVRDDIQSFKYVYQSDSPSFIYSGAIPIWSTSYRSIFPQTQSELASLRKAAKDNKKVMFSLKYLAHHYLSGYVFYVADKNIGQLKSCTKKNYELALSSIDSLVLKPGQVFNYNNHLK